MSPEKQNNEPLPEEPYHQHYDDLEKTKQENEANEEATEQKNDTKKGFAGVKALLATGALMMALPAGVAINNKIQDENRFPDNYRPVPQEQTYVEASNSVIPPSAAVEEQPQNAIYHPEGYVEAISPVDIKTESAQDVVLSPENQKALDEHWQNFEKVHEGHPMNVNDVSAYQEK